MHTTYNHTTTTTIKHNHDSTTTNKTIKERGRRHEAPQRRRAPLRGAWFFLSPGFSSMQLMFLDFPQCSSICFCDFHICSNSL